MKSTGDKILLLLAILFPFAIFGQQSIDGLVLDKETQQRIAKVYIQNLGSNTHIFNNTRGEFSLVLSKGDVLLASKEGYFNDTLIVADQKVLIFHMRRSSIYLKEVLVVARKSPEEILKQRKSEYDRAYKLADPGDLFTVGATGAGLSIGNIYNLLSKDGKNARRLTELIQKEYQENVVDSRFTPDLVQRITGLKDVYLQHFMRIYRPSYYFVVAANAYELSAYVKNKYALFKLDPNLKKLPILPSIDLEVNN